MSIREGIRKVLMKVWMESCASKNPHKTLDEQPDRVISLIEKEMPEKRTSKLNQFGGVDGRYELEVNGWNAYRDALLKRLGKK